MIAPTTKLCQLAILPLAASLLLFAVPEVWPVVVVLDLLLAVVAIGDATTLPRRSGFEARREFEPIATRGERHRIGLVIENRSRRAHELDVRDDVGGVIESLEPPSRLRMTGRSLGRTSHVVLPHERGSFLLEWIDLRGGSRLGLWSVTHRLPVADRIEVYPALRQISRYALYARQNKMSLLGVRRTRRVGTENEFERLRDYAAGDSFKAIDWRATSRRMKLTVRDFQMNQSQRVVFALDCGRMMVNQNDGLTMFDAALDAALTLAYVAIEHRDEVGILCFSDRILRWMPPRGGQGQLRRMIAATHDVQPELVESRFDEALIHLGHHCRKRTLLVLLTNVIDDRNTERIRRHVLPTVGRHLPLVVCLRDRALTDRLVAGQEGPTGKLGGERGTVGFHVAAAAADILVWRQRNLADLERAGVLTLDCLPEQLTASLVNEYLAIKARNRL